MDIASERRLNKSNFKRIIQAMARNILFWAPRILAILYILFISLFALDVFGEDYGFLVTIFALFMHLIPSFFLLAGLFIAWKRPLAGGMLFLLLSLLFTIFFHTYRRLDAFLLLSFPLLLLSSLFLLDSKS
jgi:hypothetical protein